MGQTRLTDSLASRLAALTDLDASALTGMSLGEVAEKFRFTIDPSMFFFRKVCGTVVKRDPATGIAYPVPFATVEYQRRACFTSLG